MICFALVSDRGRVDDRMEIWIQRGRNVITG